MKKIEFTVERSAIEHAVGEATAYAGAKTAGDEAGELFDRVATVDCDSGLLSRYVTDACAAAVERLRGFVAGLDLSGERVRLELEVSGAYEDSMRGAAESSFQSYLTASVMARWMRLAMPEKAAEWEREAGRLLTELERNLYHRSKPRRVYNR